MRKVLPVPNITLAMDIYGTVRALTKGPAKSIIGYSVLTAFPENSRWQMPVLAIYAHPMMTSSLMFQRAPSDKAGYSAAFEHATGTHHRESCLQFVPISSGWRIVPNGLGAFGTLRLQKARSLLTRRMPAR